MFLNPYGDIGKNAAQTVIRDYDTQLLAQIQRMEPDPGWETFTVIGDLRFDFSSRPLPTQIKPATSARLQTVVDVSPAYDLIAKLYEYLALSENWDGQGGVPPPTRAVFDAEEFVRLLPNDVA